jgi:LmbE family N-acetylglucosaminyl deacetylase
MKVLCLGAHCDDIEIGCGGTILRLQEENLDAVVQWTVFSGTSVRNAEFRASSISFLNDVNAQQSSIHAFPDGYFPHAWKEIKDCFEQMKSDIQPDLIFTHYRGDLHQDHRIISELTWNTFRNHLILEYEIPKFDGDFGSPNFFVQLSEEVCSRKIDNIMDHYPSQAGKGWFTEDTFRAVLRLRGMEASSPSKFAEGFYSRKLTY